MSLVFVSGLSFGQPGGKPFFFSEVGWSLVIPADFKIMDSLDDRAKNEQGKKLIEKSTDIIADYSETKTLISATKGQLNYFNATVTPFDPVTDGDHDDANKSVKDILHKTFRDQLPSGKIDTISTSISIDGLEFDKFQLTISQDEAVIVNMVLISKLYKGFDFGISYVYVDQQTKEQIESMLNESKFEKSKGLHEMLYQ